ncbi:MAG: DUF721 domain-containing protein [Elusimicrobia bacterium]|nr:DUF721 domain-containing protein [Elusimicrobiota bacterium]
MPPPRIRTPRGQWSSAGELISAFKARAGMQPDKIAILNAVWERELGHFSRQWSLIGVRRGVLFVRPRSAAAAQELHLRSVGIVRSLNKHFQRPWIKAVKASLG